MLDAGCSDGTDGVKQRPGSLSWGAGGIQDRVSSIKYLSVRNRFPEFIVIFRNVTRLAIAVRLICWNADRTRELSEQLETAGFAVDAGVIDGPALRALGQSSPDAVVIDLGRLPAQGRDVGVMSRTAARSRQTPLVFVDGAAAKVDRTREVLPDASYTSRDEMVASIRQTMARPPLDPVVPESNFAGYSGTPLPRKLGIKTASTVALVDAPKDFRTTLGDLPAGTSIIHAPDSGAGVTLWFLESLADLHNGIGRMAAVRRRWTTLDLLAQEGLGDRHRCHAERGSTTGLASGLVDFKICAIDATWSGLCFTRRKK